MPVYLIRAGESGPVKIGFAADVRSRLAKMQSDNHERLTVLRVFEGAAAEEAALHVRFADLRIRGEWYGFSRKMLGDVELQEAPEAEPPPVEPARPIQDIIDLLGGDAAVATALGCGLPALSNWKQRGIPKGRWSDLILLADRLGKPLTLTTVKAASEAITIPLGEPANAA